MLHSTENENYFMTLINRDRLLHCYRQLSHCQKRILKTEKVFYTFSLDLGVLRKSACCPYSVEVYQGLESAKYMQLITD